MDTKCVHRWVIETANGPSSEGICQYCKASRHFKNYIAVDQIKQGAGVYSWTKPSLR